MHRIAQFGRSAWGASEYDRFNRAAFVLLLAFSALGPFLFSGRSARDRSAMGGGAVPLSVSTLLAGTAFLILALTFFSGSSLAPIRTLAIPLACLAALVALGILQLVPLPEPVLTAIAPANLAVYHETGEILGAFGRSAPRPRITLAPSETEAAILLLLTYPAFFFASATLLQENRVRRRLFALVLFASAVTQIGLVLGDRSHEERAHGVFVNPNHFAGYLEILLALAFGVLWAEVLTGPDRALHTRQKGERLENRGLPLTWRTLLWALVAVGIVLTESRGGLLASVLTTLFLVITALLHRRARKPRRAGAAIGVALLVGVIVVAATAGGAPFSRFLDSDPREIGSTTRYSIWKTSLATWRDFPTVGAGLGAFREAFRRDQPRELAGTIEHAHSDLLHILVTGGAVGAVLGVLLVASFFAALLRSWRRQRHREESAILLGSIGALLSLLVHGLFDFNLSIPVIPATLACVLGAGWAAGQTR